MIEKLMKNAFCPVQINAGSSAKKNSSFLKKKKKKIFGAITQEF